MLPRRHEGAKEMQNKEVRRHCHPERTREGSRRSSAIHSSRSLASTHGMTKLVCCVLFRRCSFVLPSCLRAFVPDFFPTMRKLSLMLGWRAERCRKNEFPMY